MTLKLSPVLQIYDLLMLNYVEDDDAMFRYHSRCNKLHCQSGSFAVLIASVECAGSSTHTTFCSGHCNHLGTSQNGTLVCESRATTS